MADRLIITQDEFDQLKHLMFHSISSQMQREMNNLRAYYVQIALDMIRKEPPSRNRTLALTDLERGMIWTLHSIQQQGDVKLPPGFLLDTNEDTRT